MIDSWLFILGCNKSIDGVKGTKKTHIPINSITFTQTTKPKKEAPAQSNVATKVPAIEKKRGFLMRSAPRKLLEIRRRMTPTSRLRLNPNKNEMRHVKVSERQGILRKCGSGYNNGMVRVSQWFSDFDSVGGEEEHLDESKIISLACFFARIEGGIMSSSAMWCNDWFLFCLQDHCFGAGRTSLIIVKVKEFE